MPADTTWGGTSLWNIMLLAHVDGHIDNQAAITGGKAGKWRRPHWPAR